MGVTQRAPGFNGPILALCMVETSVLFWGRYFLSDLGFPFITGSSQLVMSDPLYPSKSWVFDPSKNGSDQFDPAFEERFATFDTFFLGGNLPLIESTRSH